MFSAAVADLLEEAGTFGGGGVTAIAEAVSSVKGSFKSELY